MRKIFKIGKRLGLLSLIFLKLLRQPKDFIRYYKIFKHNGFRPLKDAMFFSIKNQGYSTRLVYARALFRKEQAEFSKNALLAETQSFSNKPLISIIIPTYKTPLIWLKKCIESVQNQIYPHWQLCIVDDASDQPSLKEYLDAISKQDPRIECQFLDKKSGISKASNQALGLAKGELIALLDHDDELSPDALFWMIKAFNENPHLDFLYSNESIINRNGTALEVLLKPDWSPEYLLNNMYTGHLSVYRKSLIDQVGGFRSEYDFAQDYDLVLRVTEQTHQIKHVDRILYLWRQIKGSAAGRGKNHARITNPLKEAAKRRGLEAETPKGIPYFNRLQLKLPCTDKVSIIIPSDNSKYMTEAVTNLTSKTDYPHFEIILITKTLLIKELMLIFSSDAKIKFCPYDLPYNFSDKCNAGAKMAEGEILVFYNDDVSPVADHWLKNLIEPLYFPGVGGVSPQLLYPNKTLQYSGMYTAVREFSFTANVNILKTEQDYYSRYDSFLRDVGVLSGACLAIRKSLFETVEGFDAINTAAKHSDVDLSFKIREQELRCVYTPYSILWHIGHRAWDKPKERNKAVIYCLNRWGAYMAYDPYITPNIQCLLRLQTNDQFKIYAKNNTEHNPKLPDILLIFAAFYDHHSLSLFAQTLQKAHYNIVIVTPADGFMRSFFQNTPTPFMIEPLLLTPEKAEVFLDFAKDFDLVVVDPALPEMTINSLTNAAHTLVWKDTPSLEAIQQALL